MKKLSHTNSSGEAKMVDVGQKDISLRRAKASAKVMLNEEAFAALTENRVAKGDVLATARIAGIQAAKRTSELIPLCHQLPLDSVTVAFDLQESDHSVLIETTVRCSARTGVEMEALTAASVAALTIYDMLKGIQKDIIVTDLVLIEKTGGRQGVYRRDSL